MRIGVNSIDLILHKINAVAKRAPKHGEIFVATISTTSLEDLFVIDVVLFNKIAVETHGTLAER